MRTERKQAHHATSEGVGQDWVERAATAAAFVCLFHCLALPMVLAALPTLDRALQLPDDVHIWLFVFAAPTSLVALVTGVFKHMNPLPLLFGLSGLSFIGLGAITFARSDAETWLTVVGSLALAAAHIVNWRLRHSGHTHA